MNVITHTFVGLKCLTETKIQILCDHVDHTRFHIVEMGCQMVQLLSAHIVRPTMCVNLTPALCCYYLEFLTKRNCLQLRLYYSGHLSCIKITAEEVTTVGTSGTESYEGCL